MANRAEAVIDVVLADARVRKCAAQHFGPWMVEPAWFERAVAAVKAGIFVAHRPKDASGQEDDDVAARVAYRMTDDGIAIISIEGLMLKGDSSFGGTSTVRTRQAVRQAVRDPAVKGIMLLVDSPGGTVAGTDELAADIAAAAKVMPVHAHIEDLGASAGYYVAAQASRVTATASSLVGSIGTVAVVEDSSGRMAREGVVVHVVSTGAYKGAFEPGAPISEEHLKYLQSYVDVFGEQFVAAVAAGRRVPADRVRGWADGRIYPAEAARQMGLLDAVESQDQAMAALRQAIKEKDMSLKSVVSGAVGAVVNALTGRAGEVPPTAIGAAASNAEPVVGAIGSSAAPLATAPIAIGAAEQPAKSSAAPAAEPPAAEAAATDRATVEAEVKADLKRFTDAFGAAGAEWFAAGKTLNEAQALDAARTAAERDRLVAENADLKVRVAVDRGSPTPVSFSPADSGGAGPQRDLEAKVGKNIARVAAGIKFARKTE